MRVARPVLALAAFLLFSGLLPLAPPLARAEGAFVGNKGSKVLHKDDCRLAAKLKPENRADFATVAEAEKAGYHACKVCKPGGAAAAASAKNAIVGSEGGDTFHVASCVEAKKIKKKNRKTFASAAEATAAGLKPCQKCHPLAP